MTSDLALKPASELVELFRAKKASPVEAASAALDRIDALGETLNAFVVVDREAAMAAARASEARWAEGAPLGLVDGVPATVKDLLLARGWPTRRGSRAVEVDQPWDDDAPAVARLREHGAVLLGKTTTPEYGWKGVTDSPLTGITRNPWNIEMTPGGSSGGAAAAAAAGMGTLHLGTDGGGSIRIPAGFTGIFGLKGTFGRVPAWPHSPHGTLANVGPMTRTVTDAALLLDVISEPDPRDWYALPPEGAGYRERLEDGVKGLRVAFAPAPGGKPAMPEVATLVAAAAKVFEGLGAAVVEAEPPIESARGIFLRLWFGNVAVFMSTYSDEQQKLMDPGLVEMGKRGAEQPLAGYVKAIEGRRQLGAAMHAFFQDHDLLLTPTLPLAAFPVGHDTPDDAGIEGWVDWTPYSYPFNLTRQPAATVPCGLTGEGLPVGLQIVGPLYADARVLAAARAFERVSPSWALPPMATAGTG